jgi:hypothetical protein
MFTSYQTCRVAPYSMKHLGGKTPKVSKAALMRALTNPDLMEKIDFAFPEGRPFFTLKDAADEKVRELHVRYNDDRDVAAINVKDTWAAYLKAAGENVAALYLAEEAARKNATENLEPVLAGDNDRAPALGGTRGS